MKPNEKVVLSWCDPGTVDGRWAFDLVLLMRRRGPRLWQSPIRVESGGLLSRTRNTIVKTFLDGTDGDWLWMLDTDHQVPIDSFDLLMSAADAETTPALAGLCFGAYNVGGPYPTPVPIAHDYIDGSFVPIPDIDPRGLRRVAGVGTGCLLIHRDVLQAMRDDAQPGYEDWCWFADGPLGDGRWLSEDLTFCKRLMDRGVPLHVHTGAVFPHRKTFWQSDATYALWRTDE